MSEVTQSEFQGLGTNSRVMKTYVNVERTWKAEHCLEPTAQVLVFTILDNVQLRTRTNLLLHTCWGRNGRISIVNRRAEYLLNYTIPAKFYECSNIKNDSYNFLL